MTTPTQALCATLGMELSELREYAYQRYTAPKVYAIGDSYYAISKAIPKHEVGGKWNQIRDQFWAEKANQTIWEAKSY